MSALTQAHLESINDFKRELQMHIDGLKDIIEPNDIYEMGQMDALEWVLDLMEGYYL